MRTINPWMKAAYDIERGQFKEQQAQVRWTKRMAKGKEFLDGTHRYERTLSDKPTGEFKVMNGRDAKEMNDDFTLQYIRMAENNVPTRSLERWKVVERFVSDTPDEAPPSASP